MAIFQGEEIVPVTTPDGRTLHLPRSVVPASMQQQIGQAPPPAPMPGMQPPQAAPPPQEAAAPVLESPEQEPLQAAEVEMGEPEVTPVTMMPEEVVRANPKRIQQGRARMAAQANSPEAKMAGADAAVQSGIGAEKEAQKMAALVEGATADLVADVQVETNKKINEHLDKKAADAVKLFQDEERKGVEIDGIRKKIAATKIDRKSDHPILNSLGIALVNIGAAMNGDKSAPGLELFWKALDRKVAAQMADLDMLKDTYGLAKEDLAILKDKSGRKLELHNTLIAAEVDKAKRMVEEMVAKSTSTKIKANAGIVLAQLDQRAAQARQEGVRWGIEYDQKERFEKNAQGRFYSQLKQADRHHNDDVQLRREGMYLDYQKHLAGLKANGDEASYKAQVAMVQENEKRGIRDMNGDFLLMPQGKAMMDQAAKLEAEADSLLKGAQAGTEGLPTPEVLKNAEARAQMLREKAAQLRGGAQLQHTVRGHNETETVQVSNMLSSGQSVVQLIDEIKVLYSQRAYLSRDELQSKLQAKFQQLKPGLKEAWQLGAWDKGSAGLVETIIGADPTSEWNVGVLGSLVAQKMYENPEAFKGRLDSVAEDLENKVKNKLINLGYKSDSGQSILRRLDKGSLSTEADRATQAISEGKTPVEREAAAQPTTAGKIRDQIYSVGGLVGDPAYEANTKAAQNSGPPTHPGLDAQQAQGFNTLVQMYKKGDPSASGAIVAQIANYAKDRPDLAVAMLNNLEQYAPKLYSTARGAVPKGSPADEMLSQRETVRIGGATVPTSMLTQQVLTSVTNGKVADSEGYKELARRAGAGDQEAKQALSAVAQRRLPAGSVFNGGR